MECILNIIPQPTKLICLFVLESDMQNKWLRVLAIVLLQSNMV